MYMYIQLYLHYQFLQFPFEIANKYNKKVIKKRIYRCD